MRIFCSIFKTNSSYEDWLVETDSISIEETDDDSEVDLVFTAKSPYGKEYTIKTTIHSDYVESAYTNATRLLEEALKVGYLDLRKFKSI